jgi:hypothetical protein
MKLEYILIVVCYAYTASALVRMAIARSKTSPEQERKDKLDLLYGRQK